MEYNSNHPTRSNKHKNGRGQATKMKRKGAEEALGENVYILNDPKAGDIYAKTTEAIAEYIQSKYDRVGAEVADTIRNMKKVDMDALKPVAKIGTLSDYEKLVAVQELKDWSELKSRYVAGLKQASGLILGQCTTGLKSKLERRKDWEKERGSHNPVAILKAIREVTYSTEEHEYPLISMHRALMGLLNCTQQENESFHAYMKRFKNAHELLQTYTKGAPVMGRKFASDNAVSAEDTWTRFLAMLFVMNADQKKSSELMKSMKNAYAAASDATRNDVFPSRLEEAVTRVSTYKTIVSTNPKKTNKSYKCHKKGHIARNCPENKTGTTNAQAADKESSTATGNDPHGGREAAQFMMRAAVSMQGSAENFCHFRNYVLLDNQSTEDVFCNLNYLKNIRSVPETLSLYTNGGVLVCNTKGDLPGYGTVWCHPKAIANILSLSRVLDDGRYEVTFDPKRGFNMKNMKSGATTVYTRDNEGLFTAPLGPEPKNNNEAVNLLTTVEENKSFYTKRQVEQAEAARKLYQIIGFPSLRDYKHLVQTNQIKNCPVTLEDIKICEKIFGPDIYAMKGKTTRKTPKQVINDFVEVPKELVEAHKHVVLCMDIMYIDGVPLLTTVSKYIKYITVRYIKGRSDKEVLEALEYAFTDYKSAGFTIKEIHCDREFQSIKLALERDCQVLVNLASTQEHQPDVERALRTIKERYRAMYHRCPFSMWPKIMAIRGASEAVKWLNSFPPTGGLSAQFSPRSIILGRPIDYESHCQVGFGSFVQAYSRFDPSNTTRERTTDAIFLRTNGYNPGGI
jgi:hypothetical protein